MTTPKRVWSNKKTVWEWKKWVWKVWDEIATYDGTWSKAEWQLSTYWTSRENLSDSDNLQVYDSSSATEIWTVAENQWWDTPTLVINDELSETTGEVGWTIKIYFTAPDWEGLLFADASDIMTVDNTETVSWEEWYNRITTFNVIEAGSATLTITANPSGASDSISVTTTEPEIAYTFTNKIEVMDEGAYNIFQDPLVPNSYISITTDENTGDFIVTPMWEFADSKYTMQGGGNVWEYLFGDDESDLKTKLKEDIETLGLFYWIGYVGEFIDGLWTENTFPWLYNLQGEGTNPEICFTKAATINATVMSAEGSIITSEE